jgi:hypothetical protein
MGKINILNDAGTAKASLEFTGSADETLNTSNIVQTDSNGYVPVAQVPYVGRRNLIINGGFDVWQRGTSFTSAGTAIKTADRWKLSTAGSSISVDATRTTDAPEGFQYSQRYEIGVAEDIQSGTTKYIIAGMSALELSDACKLGFNTSNTKEFTVSFWVKSNVVGTYTFEFQYVTSGGSAEISREYTVYTADTWEYKTINVPSSTVGPSSNTDPTSMGLDFYLWLDSGTTYRATSEDAFHDEWGIVSTASRVSSKQAKFANTVGNYIQITGMQLELGSVATPFEHRSYGEELALCQRYYQRITASGYAYRIAAGSWSGPSDFAAMLQLPVPMRSGITFSTGPDSADTNWSVTANGVIKTGISNMTGADYSEEHAVVRLEVNFSSSVAGGGYEGQLRARQNPTNNPYIALDAEL